MSREEELLLTIFKHIEEHPMEYQAMSDALMICRDLESCNSKMSHFYNEKLRGHVGKTLSVCPPSEAPKFYDLYKASLLFDAPVSLDAYLIYLELNRKPNERFYQPRRRIMKQLVDAIQELEDGELDELFLSMPPRVGKTTILMMTASWLLGRNSERSNLYSAYSDLITSAFYTGILEVIQDPDTYLWHDVFPNCKIVSTNSQDETLNIDRKKRYPSLTCRSLYGTLNGACDCNGFLIMDDLLSGIEEALNINRLVSAWGKVDNNLIPRAKETAKMLWCGTRWSVNDPAGVRQELLKNDSVFTDRRYKIINLPALDDHDESNFDYDYQVGYSTDYYRQRRASFERNNDIASWTAQYMGDPIEREGALFKPDSMRYYNGELPLEEPDRIFMAVDPAFGGGDFVASPICYLYGEDIYVADVVYSNEAKNITQPLLAKAAEKHKVQAMQIEANKSTEAYKEGVEKILRDKGYHINMTSKAAPPSTSKLNRIFDKAPDILEHMIFLENGKRSKDYSLFMQNVFSFKVIGKNKNDDAPDSLSMAIDMAFGHSRKARVVKRPF